METIEVAMERNFVLELGNASHYENENDTLKHPGELLQYYTGLNMAGRKMMQDESSTNAEMVETLVKASDNVPFLYHLIRNTPNKRALFEAAHAASFGDDV